MYFHRIRRAPFALVFAFLLAFSLLTGCQQQEPVVPTQETLRIAGPGDQRSLSSRLEVDFANPEKVRILIDIRDVEQLVGGCGSGTYEVQVKLRPGALRNDATYQSRLQNPGSPLHQRMELDQIGNDVVRLLLSYPAGTPTSEQHETLILEIDNSITPITDHGSLVEELFGQCLKKGGEVLGVMVDNFYVQPSSMTD